MTQSAPFPQPASAEPLFDFERFDVYRVALEFQSLVPRLVPRRGHGALRDQLDRASASILLNVAEGFGRSSRGEKAAFYAIALLAGDDREEKPVTLLAPPDRAVMTYLDPAGAVTTFAWRVAVPSAYRLVVAKGAFDKMVVNRRLTSESMGVRGLAPGRYYWHVQVLDDDGAPAAISAAATFEVVAAL